MSHRSPPPIGSAVVKVLSGFTCGPFFTFHKFEIFRDLSALLTWGSFASQVVIAFGCYGFWLQMRASSRDSFFPVIATFAALAVLRLAPWIRERFKVSRLE